MSYSERSLWVDILIIVLAPLIFTTALGVYGAVRPRKLEGVATPEHYALKHDDIVLVAEDGTRIAGWYIEKNGEPSDAAIVVLHGYPTDKGDLLARSRFLAEHFNLLLIDFRYFGDSEGSYTTAGAKEVMDFKAAVRYLRERGIEHVGAYGFSMGGSVALMGIPELGDDLDAVVSEAAYADLSMMIREMYRYLGPLERPLSFTTGLFARLVLGRSLESVSAADAVRGQDTPVLLIHSRKDKVIGFENALLIQEALADNPNAEYLFFDEGNHGEASADFSQTVGRFFIKHLKPDSDEDTSVPEDSQP